MRSLEVQERAVDQLSRQNGSAARGLLADGLLSRHGDDPALAEPWSARLAGMSKAELARAIGKEPSSIRRFFTADVNPELKTPVEDWTTSAAA